MASSPEAFLAALLNKWPTFHTSYFHRSYFLEPILAAIWYMWISMKLLERRICFNKSEIVKFSDDRVDRMDRSRMPVVSQRMVWLHQRTTLQMCFALLVLNTRDIALKLQWKGTGEEISWLPRLIPPPIAPLLLQGMSSPLSAGYFDNFELTYMCTFDNWCLKGRKYTECWLDICLFPVEPIQVECNEQWEGWRPPQNMICFDRCH